MSSTQPLRDLLWQKLESKRVDQSWFHMDWEVHRSKVPGGWLIITRSQGAVPQGIAFYPDPDHRWDGGSAP
jgi:hypothetical protein